MKKYKDVEIGDRYGQLTVIAYAGRIKYNSNNNRKHWICLCDCGQEKICNDSPLKARKIKSCGCLKIINILKYLIGTSMIILLKRL